MASASYVIGIGSNRRHGRHGPPKRIVAAAVRAISAEGVTVEAISRVLRTDALGPSDREYANAAIRARCDLAPPALLVLLKQIERDFGRRRGRRWGTRVLDLDILAWSGGAWDNRTLAIPHPELVKRRFALAPAAEVAGTWRHPRQRATFRQLAARLAAPRPVDRPARGQ